MISFQDFLNVFFNTIRDVLPIVAILIFFQLFIIRKQFPHLKNVIVGFVYVLLGLTFFLIGLEKALFPLGKLMAIQLTDPDFINQGVQQVGDVVQWHQYKWVYLFAASIGFATAIAEPALIAVATKAHAVSGGAVNVWGLRIAVGVGVAIGLAVGSYRIISGTPLQYYIMAGYIVVIVQTFYAPKLIIALAYDSGGVATSTVTVPLVTALGLGLASTIPGRSTLLDGFGLIAFASLFPIISVMGYAMFVEWRIKHKNITKNGQGD